MDTRQYSHYLTMCYPNVTIQRMDDIATKS